MWKIKTILICKTNFLCFISSSIYGKGKYIILLLRGSILKWFYVQNMQSMQFLEYCRFLRKLSYVQG